MVRGEEEGEIYLGVWVVAHRLVLGLPFILKTLVSSWRLPGE